MKQHLPLLLATALLGGCATVSAPREELARIPIRTDSGKGMRIQGAELLMVDGRLVVDGRVYRTNRGYPLGNVHIDVEFFDTRHQLLALKSTGLSFLRARTGPPRPVSFSATADPWPEGTSEIRVSTHTGHHHP